MARPSGRPIREELLAAASTMIQRVGVNACSYGALADELGISSPTIHHHFRTKDDLIAAVVARYRANVAVRVAAIDSGDALDDIVAFADLFEATAEQGEMCLCGSVASDWMTVGATAKAEVKGFFADQVEWLADRLRDGAAAGSVEFVDDPESTARMLIALLEGAMLLSRSGDDDALASSMVRNFLGVTSR